MKVLAVDIGTGTQDILLADTRMELENALKMVMPAPTVIISRRIREATRGGRKLLLTGVTMGGGPSTWAAKNHLKQGLALFATPAAGRTFDDDLDVVRAMGVEVVSEDEAARLPADVERIELLDFDFGAIRDAFARFGVKMNDLAAVAAAVFDHGEAPPDESDRKFRFNYLDRCIRKEPSLQSFACLAQDIPAFMTRLKAVAQSAAGLDVPLVVMDTAPAAILGATLDPTVGKRKRKLVANLGNMHTLAFRLGEDGIEGVVEHHTGFMTLEKMERLLENLAEGSLTGEAVFADQGHGALIYGTEALRLDAPDFNVVVTGPRRALLRGSRLRPYFAVPFGDMMLAGCYGLLAATAGLVPGVREALSEALGGNARKTLAPWETDGG